ncbi:MAG TPA: hypothetical protein VF650_00595 [Allosphingosinicella sp.]|jgi:hypothetical protein
MAAQSGLSAALDAASARLEEEGEEPAFRERHRPGAARDEAERQFAAPVQGGAGE